MPRLPCCRATPPALHAAALATFDEKLRGCLEEVGGLPLPEQAWHQATLAVKAGGLRLRSAVRHASAAYLASVPGCEAACCGLDAHFRPGFRFTSQAAADFNAQVLPASLSRRL